MTAHNDPQGSTARMIEACLGRPLEPGQMGVLLARAGVGKTAVLTHIALEALSQGKKVLHACIDELPDKIKVWYEEIYRNLVDSGSNPALLQTTKEGMISSRFIMSYMHHTFTPSKLQEGMRNLADQVQFSPDLIVVDGLDFERVGRKQLQAIQQIAQDCGAAVWFSCRTHRHMDVVNEKGITYPCHELDDLFQAILFLEPEPQAISIVVLKDHDGYQPEKDRFHLNPRTFLLDDKENGRAGENA
ncbi:AAA domain-containing protein [Desulfacinum hydrothermale DSM 13146]|uniref:AAA domain-containing protein n=1 Tax=Desulfacinum hydrothermale DSM 13146 TaxID=1121390 RepID=A0A1W1XHB7_9BACT|nr:hypothetical protein [Desulfacinum hydrothermale]SMC23359.1 AAA domain-containing protein [Desulfacinum hydrothermale DSM 13146]